MLELRAFIVSVGYDDLLDISLGYNFHHFGEVNVITSPSDVKTLEVVERHGCNCYTTDAFYEEGADFNKWRALEEGLSWFGRNGWICLMDADILWPEVIPPLDLHIGYLYTPLARICRDVSRIPGEPSWGRYPLRPNQVEWAGYTQIFHATDPHLPHPPWHEIDWKHAGGADSFFQRRWERETKLRPPFEVLHLGPHGVNWCGRVSPRVDGTMPPDAYKHRQALSQYKVKRRLTRTYQHEKIQSDLPQ